MIAVVNTPDRAPAMPSWLMVSWSTRPRVHSRAHPACEPCECVPRGGMRRDCTDHLGRRRALQILADAVAQEADGVHGRDTHQRRSHSLGRCSGPLRIVSTALT